MYWWKGRQPALFSDKNVTVSDGKLHLTIRKEKGTAGIYETGLSRLYFGGTSYQGPFQLRLLRGQGQAHELGLLKLVLVPAGRYAWVGHRD